jgi:DNA replication protein DnaC
MERAASIAQRLKILRNGASLKESYTSDIQQKINNYNNTIGDLKDYDCKICKNKGYVGVEISGQMAMRPCKCIPVRTAIRLMSQSGIKTAYTLKDFKVKSLWQRNMLDSAEKFLEDTDGNWFYAGGQVGCGKTMLCTAIINELLKRLIPCKYMLWRDEVVNLKANVTSAEEYKALIEPLKTMQVLYIDDFFKTEKDKMPTQADINLAFEIINYRYNNPSLITIISCERNVVDLLDIDEAVGSRIYQRTKNFNIFVQSDIKKNYRLF